jgi:cellulose synthase/poly-beta-1,6-N-acetylglucosamine synthase-like glycosyltransferase
MGASDLREQVELQDEQQARASEEVAPDASPRLPEAGRFSQAIDDETVSVVIPCYNEERFIGKVLENLAAQYPPERYEIIVVDGMSTDGTRAAVAAFMRSHAEIFVRLVDNPARNIPTALNLGIEQARHEIIVRMDAHSVPSENYVRRCVEGLKGGRAAVVGMPWRIRASDETLPARAIALAVAHPFGIGDAKYRMENTDSQLVDTVPFGAFRKSLWRETGGFNEALLANEDYDFHYRVRQRGGRILLDSGGHSIYFARNSLRALATQYSRYGRWKAQMVKRHPRSLRLRQLVAPLFVVALVLLAALSLFWPLALWALVAVVVPYAALAAFVAFKLSSREGDWRLWPFILAAFPVIHIAWGSSFLTGLIHSPQS